MILVEGLRAEHSVFQMVYSHALVRRYGHADSGATTRKSTIYTFCYVSMSDFSDNLRKEEI